jgi:hypothetical protein
MPAGHVATAAATRIIGFFIDNWGKIIKFPDKFNCPVTFKPGPGLRARIKPRGESA